VAIHSQQGPQPTSRINIRVPENTEPGPDGPPPEPVIPSELLEVPDTVAPTDAPKGAESAPMRVSRVRAIWGLMVVGLLPGLVAGLAPAFWRALPTWAHWTAYTFSGVVILAVVGLVVTHGGEARE
jgi:hypothetical protein